MLRRASIRGCFGDDLQSLDSFRAIGGDTLKSVYDIFKERGFIEQITDEPQDPASVAPWVERWGAVANPLLWSHAKYLLMESEVPA